MFDSLGMANVLAFDTKHLATFNTADLLLKVTKSTVIHKFRFSKALEHILKSSSLGKHTNVVHITPLSLIRYLWTHKASGQFFKIMWKL